MKRYACVYVIKDHLGFYTETTITEVEDNEDLNDVVKRVLTDEWGWNQDQRNTMIGLNKIECFFVCPSIVKVVDVINELDKIIGVSMALRIKEIAELKVCMCNALKEE